LGGGAVVVGVEAAGIEDVVQGFDGGGAEFGGLDASAGGGDALDEGELSLNVRRFHPFGDGEDGGVELGGDVAEVAV